MVKELLIFTALLILTSTLAMATTPPMSLTQQEAVRLVIQQSFKAEENKLKFELTRLAVMQKYALLDWTLIAESGYEKDKNESPTHASTLTNQSYKTTLKLKKSLLTGTSLSFDYSRLSLLGNDISVANPKITQYTYDLLGVSVEQNLWRNFAGFEDRANIDAAEATYKANRILRASELQDLALETLRLYWNTIVAQENFNEALASRDRYLRFVSEVKRKSAYGYSNNYEVFQIQAELESREQLIKTTSQEYLKNLENLKQLLKISPETTLDFPKNEPVPDLPQLSENAINSEETAAQSRTLKSQQLKISSASKSLEASKSGAYPIITLNGSLYGSGYDDSPAISESHLLSGHYPKYYIGLKLQMQFGSDYGTHDRFNKKVALELEQQKLARLSEELKINLLASERKIQSTFFAVSSSKKQVDLREKTMNEMQRNYNNGRIDISLLIEAMNKYFTSRVQHIRAVGDYYIALNEWAAQKDELIRDAEESP